MLDKAGAPIAQGEETHLISQYGEIIYLLVKEGFITEEKIHYAHRVLEKLDNRRPLLEVIKELGYITTEQVKSAIRSNSVNMKIGSLLLELGMISSGDLETAFRIQKEDNTGLKLGEILISQYFISEKKLFEVLSLQMGYPYVEPEFMDIDRTLFQQAPIKWYEANHFIPIRREKGKILIAFADPTNKADINSAGEVFGININYAIARQKSIEMAIKRMQQNLGRGKPEMKIDEASVTGIVTSIFIAAVKNSVSDIHIEPMSDRIRIRFRQDGIMTHHKDYPKEIMTSLSSRIKVMSQSDIAEKRRHQEGRIFFVHEDQELDMRVSYYVTIFGEKIVIRLLNRTGKLIDIKDVGISPRIMERFQENALDLPSGVILVTGPTGSGKTSTVYSCINYLYSPHTCIITAEEPVECVIDGIAQCSIDPKINLTFEETLRHIVRQDPDVIVIGEIRDRYSAEVSVQAALTGHKVLTTFHTEDSVGCLIRLLNMDIEAFLIASTVTGVVAQRLLRRNCTDCSEPYSPTPTDLRRLGYRPMDIMGGNFQKGSGCVKCNHTGYRGRVAVLEVLILSDTLRDAVLTTRSTSALRKVSIESSGLVTLTEDGVYKAASGLTTIDEVLRCLPKTGTPRPLSEIKRLLGG